MSSTSRKQKRRRAKFGRKYDDGGNKSSDEDYRDSDYVVSSNDDDSFNEEEVKMPSKKRKTTVPKKISQTDVIIHSSPEPVDEEFGENSQTEFDGKFAETKLDSPLPTTENVDSSEKASLDNENDANVLDPELFPNRGFEYRVGVKIDAQDELKKWYAAKIVEVVPSTGMLLIHFDYWSPRFDEYIPAISTRLRASTSFVPTEKKSQEVYSVGDFVHAKWSDQGSYPAKIIECIDNDRFQLLYYDGFTKCVRRSAMRKMSPKDIEVLDMENFGRLTMMPNYPNPLYDPEINKRISGKRRSAIRKQTDFVTPERSASISFEESQNSSNNATPVIREVLKTDLKPIPKKPSKTRPDLVDIHKRRGHMRDDLETGLVVAEAPKKPSHKKKTVDVYEGSKEKSLTLSPLVSDSSTSETTQESSSDQVDRPLRPIDSLATILAEKKVASTTRTTSADDNVPLIQLKDEPICEPAKSSEDRKALRKAAMGVALTVAKLTPLTRKKRISDATSTSSPVSSSVVGLDHSSPKQLEEKVNLETMSPQRKRSTNKTPELSLEEQLDPTVIEDKEKITNVIRRVENMSTLTTSVNDDSNQQEIVVQPKIEDETTPEAEECKKSESSDDLTLSVIEKQTSLTKKLIARRETRRRQRQRYRQRNKQKLDMKRKKLSTKWYLLASVFKPEWQIGRSWLQFDGICMYCQPCREKFHPHTSRHNSGFVHGIKSGFVLNRVISHEKSSNHMAIMNSLEKETKKRTNNESTSPKKPKLVVQPSKKFKASVDADEQPLVALVPPEEKPIVKISSNGEEKIAPPVVKLTPWTRKKRISDATSTSSVASSSVTQTNHAKWYLQASVFKPEWQVGRSWLEFDGVKMYCKPCRNRFHPHSKGHNSGFVHGIKKGFALNRVISHEKSTAHVVSMNNEKSPTKNKTVDATSSPKFNKKFKGDQQQTDVIPPVVEQSSKVTEEKKPNLKSPVSYSCKFPTCGGRFESQSSLQIHVQTEHQQGHLKPGALKTLQSLAVRDESTAASQVQPSTISVEPARIPVAENVVEKMELDVDDEQKATSPETSVSHLAEDELVRCICGDPEENGMMVQCEQCSMWQHAACFGLENQDVIPTNYICYMCKNPLGVRNSVRNRFASAKSWLETGELPKFNCVTLRKDNADDVKRTANNRAMNKIFQNLVQLRERLRAVRFKILVANTPKHPLFQKVVVLDPNDPVGEENARQQLKEDITRLQDEIEVQLDSIDTFVTAFEAGQRTEHDVEDLNIANMVTIELIKDLMKVRKITTLLER